MNSPTPMRDFAPLFHLGAGLALFVGLNAAQSFGLCDLGGVVGVGFPLAMAFIFFVGQPRGRRGWLIAIAVALLAATAAWLGGSAIRWVAGGETGLTLLAKLAGIAIGLAGTVAVRNLSEPAPERSPTNPEAWKPISRRAVLFGLVMGVVAFGAGLYFWSWWVGKYPEIAKVGMIVAVLQAFLAGLVTAMVVIWCRPSDLRSSVSGAVAGLSMAVLADASILAGMALVQSLAPTRSVLQALQNAMILATVLILPAAYAITWFLGRRPAHSRKSVEDAG